MSWWLRFPLATLVLLLAVVALLVAFSVDWSGVTLRISNKSELLKVASTTTNDTGAVIFLHGLGGTGSGISSIFNSIQRQQPHIKFVFPTAKTMPVTLNHGTIMHSWFDLYGLKSTDKENETSIEAAGKHLQTLIAEQESLGIKRDRIVVGGLSQGGATSLYSLLAITQKPVAGILGLSTWLPLHKKFPEAAKANRDTPILLCHGDADRIVSLDFAQLTAKKLKTFNSKVEFKIYPGLAHWVNAQVMNDVSQFIAKCLSH